MDRGDAELRAIIAQIQALPAALVDEAAPEIARELHGELTRQIAAGTDPYGKPWPATQEGKRPLVNAAHDLRVSAVGSSIVARLNGAVAMHHRGAVRGGIVRQVLPSNEITAPIEKAIKVILDRRFELITKGTL